MSTAVQLRRGSTAEHATFTGLQAEATVDTTKNTLVIHNGSTVGGTPLLKENLSNANPANLASLNAADTASDDTFLIYDQSALAQKKITKAELFTNLAYTGTLTGGTGVINIGSGQLYKDASGNVGIGMSSPGGVGGPILTIAGNNAGLYSTAGSYPGISVDSYVGLGLGNASNTTGSFVQYNGTVRNASATAQVGGMSIVSNASGFAPDITFWQRTGGSTSAERMRIDSSGNLLVGTTTATANGGDLQVSSGITFPATQVAKSDANTLDDYEEGTFTPVLTGSTSGTFNGSGKYTKIGDVVNVYIQFREILPANKPIGNYTITGLPFTSRATVPDSIPLTIGALARVTFDASKVLVASIDANTTTVSLGELVTNGLSTALTDANFVNANTMFFRVSGSYPTTT
jgi:hypothetical protein